MTTTSDAAGVMDAELERIVRGRFDRLVQRSPTWATFQGIHEQDDRLGDTTREAFEEVSATDRRDLEALEALDTDGLSPEGVIERDIALYAVRRSLFDVDVERLWERRATAVDDIGDGLFAIFARDFAPLGERLVSMTGRLEHAERVIEEQKTRVTGDRVRLWDELELESATHLPSLFDEIFAAARIEWPDGGAEMRRLEAAIERTNGALEGYKAWLTESIGTAGDDFPLGRERYDELVALRAFDGLTTDDILAIGEEQLAEHKEGRRRAAAQVDSNATEAEVVDRLKSDHPPTFEEALAAYRDAMDRARAHIIERDLATTPPHDALAVIETPEYLRNVLPFAAYFDPPRFDPNPAGIYVVTPSVDGDPRAMREHSYASISNTSIHEAYPGHHLQLSAAITHPSLARVMGDAPEFVEGWGMYSEQMMREEGFDAEPHFLVNMHTDAIWRACRIILDIKLHRGEISVPDAIDYLIEHTGFERPNAAAEVNRYTYTSTYQLSYLLGKVLLLRLRDDERRRLGSEFSLKGFHDALLYGGSIPVSFHRRLLEGGLGARAVSSADAPTERASYQSMAAR